MFEEKEVYQVLFAVLLISYIIAFSEFTFFNFLIAFIIASIILIPHIIAHKIAAENYIAESKFKFLEMQRYWFNEGAVFKYPFPIWLVLPIFTAFVSFGKFIILTIETCEIKWKPEKRIGRWYTELQEHEISNIALAGPLVNIVFAFIASIVFSIWNLQLIKEFAILNMWFAFFCLLPLGNLDGTKILFGGKIRWTSIFIFTIAMLIMMYYLNVFISLILALILASIVGLWFLREELPPRTPIKPIAAK
ncbi:MAG: hypothetical protein KJ767_03495 [Nanoarchaeota archaeon]|nr:hypothetical protein [Nanoarchaeota archaeon]